MVKVFLKRSKKRFLESFYRSDNKIAGFGIGLSFSLQIIKAHKGYIKLKSESEKGSTFYIILPLKEYDYKEEESS